MLSENVEKMFKAAEKARSDAGDFHVAGTSMAKIQRQIADETRKAQSVAERAAREIDQIRNDRKIPQAERDRQVAEMLQAAETGIQKIHDRAETAVEVMKKEIEKAGLPELDSKREAFARQDAEMLLRDVKSSADAQDAITRLSRRGDDVAALVAGQWGRDYLQSRGVDRLDAAHASVRAGAMSEKGQDQLKRSGKLQGSVDASKMAVYQMVEGFRAQGGNPTRDPEESPGAKAVASGGHDTWAIPGGGAA